MSAGFHIHRNLTQRATYVLRDGKLVGCIDQVRRRWFTLIDGQPAIFCTHAEAVEAVKARARK